MVTFGQDQGTLVYDRYCNFKGCAQEDYRMTFTSLTKF